MIAAIETGMTWLDGAVIGLYAAAMLAVGVYYARANRTTEEYLLGGRNMRSSFIGLSLFATLFSTITYLALPGEMINKGPAMLSWMVAIPLIYGVVGYVLIPRFMRVKETSAYAILERRLGMPMRLAGSVFFVATRLLWMALILYVTADKVIVQMMGWPSSYTPLVAAAMGLVTVVYSSMGGIRAVVLTDVVQSFILFAAAVTAILLITIRLGGVGNWIPTEWSPSWDNQPILSFDPRVRATVVGSIVTFTLWWICTSGSDQMAIQRYFSTRDVRAARRAFLITMVANAAVSLVLGSLGFALLAFFRAHPQPGLSIEKHADVFLTYYIIHFLPPGVTGLVIAGLLAAAMSSLSSGINSLGAVIGADFLRYLGPVSEARRIVQTKLIAWAGGLVAVLLSLFMGRVSGNTMEITVRTNHVFTGPLFGLFVMALFVPFSTGLGAALGTLAGCSASVLIAYWDLLTGGPTLSFQWITLVSLTAHLAVGCGVSWIQTRGKARPPGETTSDV